MAETAMIDLYRRQFVQLFVPFKLGPYVLMWFTDYVSHGRKQRVVSVQSKAERSPEDWIKSHSVDYLLPDVVEQ